MRKVGSVGLVSVIGCRSVKGQPSKKDLPDTYDKRGTQGDSFEDPAYFHHIADKPATKKSLRRYERNGSTKALLVLRILCDT